MTRGLYSEMPPWLANLVIGYRKWWRVDQLVLGYSLHQLRPNPSELLASLRRKSDELIILGTGSSVRSKSSNFWIDLDKKATIGVNDFVCHDFKPDAYSIEMYTLAAHTTYVLQQIRRETPEIPTLVKVPWWGTTSRPLWRVRWGSRKFYLQTGVPLTCNSVQTLISELKTLHSIRSSMLCVNRPADLISSVFRLAYAAAYSGFRKISLVGVADGSTEYFWSDVENHPLIELKRRENELLLRDSRTDFSGYVEKDFGHLTLSTALQTLATFAERELGVEILLSGDLDH